MFVRPFVRPHRGRCAPILRKFLAASAFAAGLAGAAAHAQIVIQNVEERPNPWVVNGSPEAARKLDGEVEQVGERRFRFLRLSRHTGSDLCLFEERSGLLFAGDLVFLDRAPTTPDARPAEWRTALDTLAGVPNAGVVPEHGPVETGSRGIGQTRNWLDMVEERIADGYERGLDVTELMAVPLPAWAEKMAVARYEFARSTMHLLPKLEAARLPLLTT